MGHREQRGGQGELGGECCKVTGHLVSGTVSSQMFIALGMLILCRVKPDICRQLKTVTFLPKLLSNTIYTGTEQVLGQIPFL